MVEAARHVPPSLLPTTVVGSYPQPDWLIDRERARRAAAAARARARALARRPELPRAGAGRRDAARDRDMERAGIDIVTDGEMRRESYSNRFATALDGVDLDNPGVAIDRTGHENPVPRVVGPIRAAPAGRGARRRVPARAHGPHDQDHPARPVHDVPAGPERPLRATRPSSRWPTPPRSTRRLRDLKAAGADVVQIDEPYLQARPGGGPRVRRRGDRPGARGDRGRRPRCTSASATPRSSTTGRPRLLVPRGAERAARATQISIEAAQPRLDLGAPRGSSPTRRSSSASLDLGDRDVETPGGRRRAHPRRARARRRPSG